MLGLLLPLVLASVVGALWVGSTAGLQRTRIQWWPLAVGSIGVQLGLYNPPIDHQPWALTLGPWIWVASLVGLAAVCIRNSLFKTRAGRILPGRTRHRPELVCHRGEWRLHAAIPRSASGCERYTSHSRRRRA